LSAAYDDDGVEGARTDMFDGRSSMQIDLDGDPDKVRVAFSAKLGLERRGCVGHGLVGDAQF
jgi:hypothetical protein